MNPQGREVSNVVSGAEDELPPGGGNLWSFPSEQDKFRIGYELPFFFEAEDLAKIHSVPLEFFVTIRNIAGTELEDSQAQTKDA